MKTANGWKDYEIIATGNGEKLERWGSVFLLRPDPQIIWPAKFDLAKDKRLNAKYERSSTGGGAWTTLKPYKNEWQVTWKDLKFWVKPMGFKHTGLFPEQAVNWEIMQNLIKESKRPVKVLNLFAYTGAATVACLTAGASVTHVDAAKNMVERCKENVELNGLKESQVRYIVDDCAKFVTREIKRGNKYDAIIMDPPSYGRGTSGEVWKLEDSLFEFVRLCKGVLSDKPLFVLINSYTTGLQPTVIANMLELVFNKKADCYEVCLPTNEGIVLPCGCSGVLIWKN